MTTSTVDDMARKLRERLLAYGPDRLRLMLSVMRLVERGAPLTAPQAQDLIVASGIVPEDADAFLRQVTERSASDEITGVMGLSLNDHPHRLTVADIPLSAWCALDTLFLPSLLRQTATIESLSPVSRLPIKLRVSPERVEDVSPTSAVISIVIVDLNADNMASVEAVWSAFCDHVHFFVTREEAEGWSASRNDIAILTVDEGFTLGRQVWADLLSRVE